MLIQRRIDAGVAAAGPPRASRALRKRAWSSGVQRRRGLLPGGLGREEEGNKGKKRKEGKGEREEVSGRGLERESVREGERE